MDLIDRKKCALTVSIKAKDPEKLATLTPKALSSTSSKPEEAISTDNDGDEKREDLNQTVQTFDISPVRLHE
jgi:hypothetical protein